MCDSDGAVKVEKPFVVACIPAFNEENTIGRVVLQAKKYVDRVLVCDDGSQDLTGEIAGGLGAAVVRHERNKGMFIYFKKVYTQSLCSWSLRMIYGS